jgi:hypothetical protein
MDKRSWIYNIECYPNYFQVTFLDTHRSQTIVDSYINHDIDNHVKAKTNRIDLLKRKNELKTFTICTEQDINESIALIRFLQEECYFLIGFNNNNYDELMLSYVCMYVPRLRIDTLNRELYKTSSKIVAAQDIYGDELIYTLRRYAVKHTPIDMMKVALNKIERKSLMQIAISLKWYKVDSQPFDINAPLTTNQIQVVDEFNINQVLITDALYNKLKEDVILRININCTYNFSVYENALIRDKPGIADILFAKFYAEATGLEYNEFKELRTHRKSIKVIDCIHPIIQFKTPNLQKLLDDLKEKVISSTRGDLDFEVQIGETIYMVKSGGLHSKDEPLYLTYNPNVIYRDKDVKGYYPALIYKYKFKPEHCSEVYCDAAYKITLEKDAAQKAGDKTKREAMKIINNSGIFGKMGSQYHWSYDRKALVSVTINGQLLLLMLIETLTELSYKIISANTDGFTTLVPKDREEEFEKVCKDWEELTKLELETTDYETYVRYAVNDYATKEVGKDKYKEKGSYFIRDMLVNKGYYMPIISIALHNYFFKGVPIIRTIASHRKPEDIYNYCLTQKVGGDFRTIFHTTYGGVSNRTILQKNNRYYVTTESLSVSPNIGFLFKEYTDPKKQIKVAPNKSGQLEGKRKKPIGISSNEKVKLFNKYHKVNHFRDYKVDYNYYIKQCNSLINEILHPDIYKKRKKADKSNINVQLKMF